MAIGLLSCSGASVGAPAPTTTRPPAAAATSTTEPPITVAPTTVPPTTVPPTTTTVTTVPAVPITVKPAPPPTTAPAGPPPGLVTLGASGPLVLLDQQRLTALGYWLGTPDGHFGSTTQQAVWALQKAAGLPRSGFIDPATAAALGAGTLPTPTSTTGHVIEVNLATQLVMIVTNGHLDAILNTSTGGGYVYFDHGVRNVAITPKGQFTTYREVDGVRVSSLGTLFRPKYFTGGFAIHGDSSVPAHAVSHGCVRVSDAAINWIWSTNSDPIGTSVWIY